MRIPISFVLSSLVAGSSLWAEPVAAPRPDRGTVLAVSEQPLELAALTQRVRKSVVVVTFAGRDGRTQGLGSGFVVSPDGLIATNMHVIGEARPIAVQFPDGRKFNVVEIHATERKMDLAIVRVEARGLTALPLGDSATLKQGQRVAALGNPRGLRYSVVGGVVSGRRVLDGRPMLQLAMAIEKGNSGGPVLDLHGRVQGVLTLKSNVTANLGFAVEVNALKPLLKQPNPVPIDNWLTIGRLNPAEWKTLFGARWRQRAGRISVDGRGEGFGGRSLALSQTDPPKVPFEVAVSVRLGDESGAAGLVFHADGHQRHYGFYPSNGSLRFSRFDGADVFSWQVLEQVRSDGYRRGAWNTLKIRVEKDRIRCFVNDRQVVESTDGVYTGGKIGLAKFRETAAEFKRFRVGSQLASDRPDAAIVAGIAKLSLQMQSDRPPRQSVVDALVANASSAGPAARDRATQLEQQARRLRQLARLVHESAVRREIAVEMKKSDDDIDLLKVALLIARLDNEEVDVPAYLKQTDRLAADIRKSLPARAGEAAKLAALDRRLFHELGFHGSRTNYYSRSNSYLNEVIDDREGLPIALSVLYMEIGRRLGLTIEGVGLPGHFVVRFRPSKGEPVTIDPFDRGRRMTKRAVETFVRSATGGFDEQFLAAQSKRQIVIRMLNNLMGLSRETADAEQMLKYVETLLVVDPDNGGLRWMRAVLHFQSNRPSEARTDVDWVLSHRPAGVDLDRVRQLQQLLKRRR